MADGRRIGLITGAGSGIGRRTAFALWEAGYDLALAGRRVSALRKTVEMAGVADDRALVMPTDVADRAAVGRLFAEVKSRFGRLDLLFNNAGISASARSIEELGEEQWQTVIAVNVTGAFWCLQEAFRLMKTQEPRGGRIINNGSISAQTPRPNSALYTTSKHALTGLTKAAALDGRDFDIVVSQIDIGNARTEMSDAQQQKLKAAGKVVEAQMDSRHVADAIVYMANLPLDTNVLAMTVLANKMPFIGRG